MNNKHRRCTRYEVNEVAYLSQIHEDLIQIMQTSNVNFNAEVAFDAGDHFFRSE